MWGRIQAKPKIVTAKQVMNNLISKTPNNIAMGLLVYGHNRKGDCRDIELLASPGDEKLKITTAVQSIMPKGRTPLAKSLETAGALLDSREEKTTIVLVSDGIETCSGTPCDIAGQLVAKGHKVVIHAVGFDVSSKAAAQLRCIAKAGGGKFFQADDEEALVTALHTVQKSVVQKQAIVEEAPEPVHVSQVDTSGPAKSKRIRITGLGKLKLNYDSWVESPKYWQLAEAETGEVLVQSQSQEARIKEGEYQVLWRQAEHGYNDVPLTAVITIKRGETSELSIDTGIQLHIPQSIPQPKWWGLAAVGDTKPLFTFAKGLGPHVVPAGTYRVLWRQSEHGSTTTALSEIKIVPGKLNQLAIDSTLYLQPADWMADRDPYYFRLKDKTGAIRGHWNSNKAQLAPAGTYNLIYRPTQHGHNEIHWGEVTIPEHGTATVPLDSGIIFIHQKEAKPPYRVFLTNLKDNKEIVIKQNWQPLPVPPGSYRIDLWQSQHGSKRQLLVDEVTFEAGSALELEL